MNETMRLFLRRILLFSAFLAFTAVILSLLLPAGFITPATPVLIVFFLLLTWVIIRYLMKASDKSFVRFVNAFMITTGLKLLLLILIVIAYIFLNRKDAVPFIIVFFILYLCYTGFEVYTVLYLSKHQKKE